MNLSGEFVQRQWDLVITQRVAAKIILDSLGQSK
jgi:hypothetical protein